MYKKKLSIEQSGSNKTSNKSTKPSTKFDEVDFSDIILGVNTIALLKEAKVAEALTPDKPSKQKKAYMREKPDFTVKDKGWIEKIRAKKISIQAML